VNKPEETSRSAFWNRRLAWIDAPVLALLLLAVNSLIEPGDIGWLSLHPSPFLLLPIIIGGRYGFIAGLCSGALAAGLAVGGQSYLRGVDGLMMVRDHAYFVLSLLVLGGLSGQIQRVFRVHDAQARATLVAMEERMQRLDGDLYLTREAKAELERLLATRDSEVSTLDSEIRRLFDCDGEELYSSLLLLLNRQSRVTDAALYQVEAGGFLQRKSILGSADHLPERISPGEVEMAALALERKTCVSVPDFWQRSKEAPSDHLLAAPLLDSKHEVLGLVLVTGIPFIALTRKTVHVIMLVCRWAARVIELRDKARAGAFRLVEGFENQRLFSAEVFRNNLSLCHQSYQDHGLPSSIVLFVNPKQPLSHQPAFEKVVMESIRGGDFPTVLDLPHPNVAVLLPLSGERGASVFIQRILMPCRSHPTAVETTATLVQLDDRTDPTSVWDKLHHAA